MHGFEITVKKEKKYWTELIKCWDAWLTFLGFLRL